MVLSQEKTFEESDWLDILDQVEHTYKVLAQNQLELESKNISLKQTQSFLSNVLASMTDILVVCDSDNRIVQCNQALEKLLGQRSKDLIGQPVSVVFSMDDKNIQAKLQRNEPIVDCEVQVMAQHHQEEFSINCSPRFDQRERMVGRVFIGRPVGELKSAYRELQKAHERLQASQEELIESEKMASLGRLISGIAHEINNPISFIYGNIFVLEDYFKTMQNHIEAQGDVPKKIQDIFSDLPALMAGNVEGLERTEKVIKGLRDFSSIHKDDFSSTQLVAILQTAILWTKKSRSSQQKIAVTADVNESVQVYANVGKLYQLFVNLLQNAFDATKDVADPHVEVTAKVEGGFVVVDVCDNGSGTAPESISNFFDPFYSTKKVGQGMGLGLYICYNIVKEHQGHIEAKNNSKAGMTFTVSLPQEPHDD